MYARIADLMMHGSVYVCESVCVSEMMERERGRFRWQRQKKTLVFTSPIQAVKSNAY
jgi:hypothetical protein